MSRPLRRSERRFLLALGDTLAAATAVVLALWTWSITAGFAFSLEFLRHHVQWLLAVPLWVAALSPTRQAGAAWQWQAVARGLSHAAAALFIAYLIAFFTFDQDRLPRLMALYVLWNAAWLTMAWRVTWVWALRQGVRARGVAIVGDGAVALAALRLLEEPAFADATLVAQPAATLPPSLEDLTDVIVAHTAPLPAATVEQLVHCQEAGIDVATFAHLHEHLLRRVPVRHVGHDWVLSQLFTGDDAREMSPIAKRLLDLAGAGVLTVIGLVPGLVAALAIWAESGRPVFYTQLRAGRGGRPFPLTKLRTMRHDAEPTGPQWSPIDDPRITRVGRLLRRMHLDELPNLLAVFRGDMSLVGPRPERPEFVQLLEHEVPLYRARLTVAPGLTGWAQVKTEYGDSVDDATRKLEYDLYYVRHQSIWFDLSILLRTVGRMVGWKGR